MTLATKTRLALAAESFDGATAAAGNITVTGAVQTAVGLSKTFASLLSTGDIVPLTAVCNGVFEEGLYTFTSPTTFARTRIDNNSNGDNSPVTFTAGTGVIFADLPTGFWEGVTHYDYLINGNGQVSQAGLVAIADDVYGHDQWYALTQTGNITPSTLPDPENGLRDMIRLTQSNAAAQRFGYAQIIEGRRCKKLRGRTVTLGGRVRMSTSATVRFAVLEMNSGTEDVVTSDVVADWTSATYTNGNFFLAAPPTISAVGSKALTAATFADWSLTLTLGSLQRNLVVFIWTDAVAAQNVTLDFTASLRQGYGVPQSLFRDYQEELLLCQRFYWEISGAGNANTCIASAMVASTTLAYGSVPHPVKMRTNPVVTVSAGNHFLIFRNGPATVVTTALVSDQLNDNITAIKATVAAGLTAGEAVLILGNSTSARLKFNAQL